MSASTREPCRKRTWCIDADGHHGKCVEVPGEKHDPPDFGPKGARVGRKNRARVVVELLQLALNELETVEIEADVVRIKERAQLANRLIADALVSVNRWEARG